MLSKWTSLKKNCVVKELRSILPRKVMIELRIHKTIMVIIPSLNPSDTHWNLLVDASIQ